MVLGAIAGTLGSVVLAADSAPAAGSGFSTVVIGIAAVIGILLGGVGLVMALWGGFQNLVLAFRTSVLWGLAVIFIPGAGVLFLILYWQDAKQAFFLTLKGWGFIVGAGLISGLTVAFFGADAKHRDSRDEASTLASASADEDAVGARDTDLQRSVSTSEPSGRKEREHRPPIKTDGSPASVTDLMPIVSKLAQDWKPGSVLVRLEATKMRAGLVDTANGGRVTFAFRPLSKRFADQGSTLEIIYDQAGLNRSVGVGLPSDEPLSWATGCSAEEAIVASGSPNGEAKGLFFIVARGSGASLWLIVRPDGSDARIQASSCAVAR